MKFLFIYFCVSDTSANLNSDKSERLLSGRSVAADVGPSRLPRLPIVSS